MRKIIFQFLIVFIIGSTIATIYSLSSKQNNVFKGNTSETTYKEIDKMLTGFIFSEEDKIVKEIPIKISGKQYTQTSSYKDYFAGVIEIEGEVIKISNTNNVNAVSSNLDTSNYYLAINPPLNNTNGVVEYAAYIKISKDFNTSYGYTQNLKKTYGQKAYFKSGDNVSTPRDQNIGYIQEVDKRVNLYVLAMKSAFKAENGGSDFIAVKSSTLEGLSDEKSKQKVLEGLKGLSQKLYWYEDVKDDKSLFEFDTNGRVGHALNGTVLSIKVEKYSSDKAVIEATSWFGNLGAVFIKYEAIYKNGQWQLKASSMAVS